MDMSHNENMGYLHVVKSLSICTMQRLCVPLPLNPMHFVVIILGSNCLKCKTIYLNVESDHGAYFYSTELHKLS